MDVPPGTSIVVHNNHRTSSLAKVQTVSRARIAELFIIAYFTEDGEPHAQVVQSLDLACIVDHLCAVLEFDQERRLMFRYHREASFLS